MLGFDGFNPVHIAGYAAVWLARIAHRVETRRASRSI
jgi:hypothetical protein